MLSVAALALSYSAPDTCQSAIAQTCAKEPTARDCVKCVVKDEPRFVKESGCTAALIKEACLEGRNDLPNVFGCYDVTAAGCGACFDHKVAFENVCVWCKTDSTCHDVGSLEDPCTDDQCISIAVKTKCTDHDKADCPSEASHGLLMG